ncbi:hypothetical protein B0T22DRAFT_485412 [Podospora appendiculata]|uniref:Ketoreductase domain-containing protein n=1 Tax=Podospora appendiculata TaxID=314037 RepID=A0AAE1C7D0_9PEZI|nr:hypothetical protein B0T22DRAFT_485412 [Podospora appendiculata]
MPFPYKTVLITGATSGIGLALAEKMIASDIFVIAVGRRKDRLDALVAKHGPGKVAGEVFDVSDLAALGPWASKITTTYPTLDALLLNAGFQRTLDFTTPSTISLPAVTAEVATNYLSPVHTITHFLSHLLSLSPSPAAILLVSSGLAVIPFPRCANYSATKSAIHSLAWSLRSQLAGPDAPHAHHMRVVELLPPAVQTELHPLQPDLVAAGQDKIGIPLAAYVDETWADLISDDDDEAGGTRGGERDEIAHTVHREKLAGAEEKKREGFRAFVAFMRKQGAKF